MDDFRIRRAEEKDAAQIAMLFCLGFRPEVAQLLIYGCKGAANYIRMQIASSGRSPESLYFTADTPGRVIAAVELRRAPDRLFLNYIGVHPDHHGKGIGTRLLAEAIKMSAERTGKICLDVFADNLRALEWYARLGFKVLQTSEFIEVIPSAPVMNGTAYLSDLPQADLCQERFGFSRFNLVTAQRGCSVGRIGDGWFRLNDSASLADPDVFSALRLLDPTRRIFTVVPWLSVPESPEGRLLTKSHRMEAEILRVLGSL
jgi:ribosomal protein S18 acetylase RimI-like enzyme